MNIRFSKQSKRRQIQQLAPVQCRLLTENMLFDPVVQRRKTFSRRKSNQEQRSQSKSGLNLSKNNFKAGNSVTNQQDALPLKSTPYLSLNSPKYAVVKQQKAIPKSKPHPYTVHVRTNTAQIFHGSWGIPKYCKLSEPVKQITRISSSRLVQKEQQQKNKEPGLEIQMTPCHRVQRSQQNENWKFSKYMNSTNVSKNDEVIWNSSVKLVESQVLNQQFKSQTLFPKTPHTSVLGKKDLLYPISNLYDARQVNTVFSEYSHQSRQLSEAKFSKSLKESLVIANDANEEGFWD